MNKIIPDARMDLTMDAVLYDDHCYVCGRAAEVVVMNPNLATKASDDFDDCVSTWCVCSSCRDLINYFVDATSKICALVEIMENGSSIPPSLQETFNIFVSIDKRFVT